MRKMNLTLVVLCLFSFASAVLASDGNLLGLTIDNSTGKYTVTVTNKELGQTLRIAAESSGTQIPIVQYSGGGFIYAVPKYPKMDRLITVWQPGVALNVVVFRLAPSSQQRKEIVFSGSSEIEPDILNSGYASDFMLLYTGKRFVKGSNQWVPRRAVLYEWNGRSYRLIKTVPYEQRFQAVAEVEKRNSVGHRK